MLTEHNKKLFTSLGLPLYDEDQEEVELPFAELEEEKAEGGNLCLHSGVRKEVCLKMGQALTPFTSSRKLAMALLGRVKAGSLTCLCAVSMRSS